MIFFRINMEAFETPIRDLHKIAVDYNDVIVIDNNTIVNDNNTIVNIIERKSVKGSYNLVKGGKITSHHKGCINVISDEQNEKIIAVFAYNEIIYVQTIRNFFLVKGEKMLHVVMVGDTISRISIYDLSVDVEMIGKFINIYFVSSCHSFHNFSHIFDNGNYHNKCVDILTDVNQYLSSSFKDFH